MTCQQFRGLMNQNPFAMARAERLAFANHFKVCQACGRLLEYGAAEASELHGDLSDEEVLAITGLADRDSLDPEAR